MAQVWASSRDGSGREMPEAGSRKPEAGSRKPEAGSRKPEAGSRKPEAMTAPRSREQSDPPSPPDRRPPRRGGGSSPSPCTCASAAGRAAGPARLCGARRGLVRSARALAAAALLALAGALALPATAQADVLVSNIGQTSDATATVGFGDLIGQVFTVASGGGNYTLTSIEVPVELLNTTALTAEDIELLSASLWSADEFGAPGSSLQALTNPSSISDGDTAAFTDPAGTTLEAGKLYAVMFVYDKSSAELAIKAVRSNDEDGESLSGWTIYNSRRNLAAGETSWTSDANSLQIRVNGSAAGGTPTCTLNTGDLWCGVVTVAAISSGGSVAAHGFAGADGGLDDKTFSVGTNNYTIDGLYVGTAGDLNLDLTGALDAADKGNLKLVVGSTDFDLDDATHVSSENAYLWTGTGLDWSSDTHVTLRLRRAVALSTDATLSGLTVYDGSSNLTLSPSFASGTEAYTASAAYDIATVTVTANKNQADATIAWLDASDATLVDADAMAPGRQVALEAGANTFKVKVTAEDGTTTKTYTVTVNRASPSCTLNTGDLWCGVVTVGNATGYDGYVSARSIGALSDTTFSVGTNNYTINVIYVQTGGANVGSMVFGLVSGLTSADLAALVLHLGSTEFEFSDAFESGGKSYAWRDTGLDWSSESFVTLRLRDTPVTNNAPVFSPTTATREVEENSAAGTNVGAVIPEATDADSGDTLTYSMEGTDAASFAFDASTRQITTITGVTYNYEATKNSYSVTVKASDGTASATIAVTIDVTDVNEKSAKPDKPTLAAVTGSSTTLTATWTKPDLNGGPDIAGYDLQYREGTTGTWTAFAHTGAALTTTITGLTADTSYQVRVRAKNGETDSDWSDASDAVKTNAAAVAPTISAVAVTSTPVLETDTYGQGERIEVTVTFSEAVNATTDTDFVLSVGGTDTRAPVLDGSGTTTLVFSYTVRASDEDDNGIWIGDQDRTLVGDRMGLPQAGAITSVATSTAADLSHSGLGTDADHKVDGSRSIVLVAVSSTPMLETDTYGAGETIRFTVTFSSGVSIGGSPVFRFSLGNLGLGRQVDAAYESGAGSAALVFGYTVVSSDEDDDGIWIGHQGQTLVGTHQTGTITIVATSEAAAGIEHDALGVLSGHKVDGSRTTGNNAPAFLSDSTGLSLPENSAAGTVIADSASVLTATDADTGDTLTYSMDGTDAASFDFDTSTREMKAKSGVTYNHEEKSTYSVTVNVDDGRGGTDTVEVTIDVTDVNEKSAKPDQPTLAKVTGSSTSLTATWTKPDLDGGPEITGYAVQYKVNTATTWEDFAHSDTAVTTTITGLTADTSYQVQVRAKNGETDSDWSDASDAVKTNAEMSTPTCTLNTGDIWCGVVTVGDIIVSGVTAGHGFSAIVGELSDKTFDVGTNSYTIDGVIVGSADVGAAGDLTFSLTSALTATDKEKLVLHVGSSSFAFSDAGAPTSTFGYAWPPSSLNWSSETSVTLRLREANTAPVFADDLVAITLPENSAVGTSVGAAVTATDADSDTLTYSLEGTDAASFDIESGTGQIKTKSGVTYDFEAAQNTYEMTVKADDGNGGTDTIEVNIALLDADEKSAKPDKPTLAAVAGSSTSLTATWEKPDLDGGPDIAGYDLQYREGTTGTWEDFAHSDTAVTTTVTGLTADTSYQVQVRAKNGETDSDWSDASDAVKTNAEMSTTTCTLNTGDLWCGILTVGTSTSSGTTFYGYDLHESQGSLSPNSFMYDGNTITVTGLQYDVGSGNALRFDFTTSLGTGDFVLHVGSQSFDFTGGQASYSFTSHGLSWSSGNTVEVRLREAATAPGEPTDLTATANGTTRIDLSWTAPADDGGSAITGYRIEVSTDAGSNWSDLVADTANTDTTYSHTGLSDGDTRHYQVSAINAVGTSDASNVANATTGTPPTTCTLNTGDLWCGVVTVGQFQRPPFLLDGFGEGEGDLSDTEFTYGTNSYTIDIAATELNNTALFFSLTSALTAGDRAALELHVAGGNASFAFSAANHNSSDHTYTWRDTGLDWSSESFVELRLRAATETDATLSALSVTHPRGTVPLRPAFAPGTGEYRAWVANPVNEVTVAATANVAAAEVAYLDGDGAAIADADTNTPGREVALEVGATVVEVKVTAEDGTTMRTYRVTVTRGVVEDLGIEGEFRLAPETVVDYADPDNDRRGGMGPVEVYHAGAWGTVCRDGIRPTFKLDDNNELIVDSDGKPLLTNNGNEAVALICKAMNYDDGEYHMKYGKFLPGAAEADHQVADYWPPGSSYPAGGPKPIWLDDLRCVAGESALGTDPLPGAMSHCSYAGWGLHNCTHKEDAVVRCWNNDAAGAGLKSLKGRFVSPPERHDGTNRVKVRVAFSEPVEESPENVGAHGVEVEGGEVTSVSPVGGAGTGSAGGRNAGAEDREVVWEFEIEPDSDGDLTVTLEAGRPCGEPGAICTADGRALSEGISTTVEGPEAPPPLTASFEDLPAAHDGSAFTFRVAFSRDIGISYEALREDAFAVSGGRTTRGARVDDRRDLFEMTVEPDGGGDVAITLEADRDCAESGAICTKGEPRRRLTNSPSATVAGPDGAADGAATGAPAIEGTARVGGTLTATTADIADRDGLDDVEFAYRWMRGDADIAGADGRTYAAADADLGERLKVRVEFADDAGNAERLTSEPTDAVAAAADEAAPLTARFEDMPAEHRGEGGFKFRAAFSEDIGISYKALREDAFAVSGGRVTGGKRVDDRRDLFEMTVRPDGGGDVGIALEAGRECAESGAICTKGEPRRKLANSPSATVAGPGEAPANTPAEGRPAISGTARVGEALTASTAGVSDADGLENAEFAYQWRRGGADIPGADGASYAVVEADEGERLKVRVAFADDAGNAERLTSAATDAVEAAPRANAPAEGAPAIRGKARVGEALTASTSGVTDADGLDNAVFAHQWLRGGADIPGATGATYTVVEAHLGERLKVRVAFEDDAGNEESLTSAATDAVEAAPRANTPAEGGPAIRGKARVGGTLTASTSGVSDADGLENAEFAHQWLRGGADIPGATGASYAAVEADLGERLKVRVEFADDAGNEESLTSAATKAVAPRPRPKVSVADARVREAAGATLDFAVTLSAPAPGPVTVGYRTLDASAKAGEDYEARAGKLRFGAGETAKTLRVKVLDDAVDEGDEKMVVVLEPGAGVDRGDRLASGTIENSDPLPAAWLARFGRTASDHAAEAIEERFRDPGGASHATFGGRRLWGGGGLFDAPAHGGMPGDPFACGPFGGAAPPDRGADPGTNAGIDCGAGAGTPPGMNAGPNGAMGAGMNGGMSAGTNRGLNGGMNGGMGTGKDGALRGPSATGGHRPRPRDLLLGSSFRLSASGADEYGSPRRLTAWGRAAATRFDGVADGVAVDGEVATFLVGADASRNRWLAGITVAHSVGAGAFRGGPGGGAGGLDSTLTAVHPYARWRASERLSAWGALGYGAGDLALETNGSTWETDTSMRMAAGGLRGVFLRGAGGLELAARTDVRLTRIASDGVEDNEAGLLAAAAGGTSRLRLLVEGSRPFRFGDTRLLTPTLEIGVRRDGGDAETGAGIDLGGSLRYADAALGLTAEAAGRYLVAHEDAAYREWGASASVRIDPGAPGRGLTLSVTPSWGASATGGAERLWSVRDARGLAGHGFDAAMRLRADVGYGLSAFRGMGAATPFLGLSTTGAMGRDWRFGARWTRGAALRMSLEATRRETAGVPPARGIQFGITWRPGARGPSPAAGAAPAGAPRTGARCPGDGTRREPPPVAPACSRAPPQHGPAHR